MPEKEGLVEHRQLTLHDRLGLIGLIDEGMREGSTDSPVMADLFSNLWRLVGDTVKGSKIDQLSPNGSDNLFRVLEVRAETGEILGRLNMLYLNKPIPCYYLVYVEVATPFRKHGLGHRIISHFKEFLREKAAVGLLDNIIPKDDPTYDIYHKHDWLPIEVILGPGDYGDFMIYIPPWTAEKFKEYGRDIREPVLRLIHHLKRRRTAIDMRDNEIMVRQTIAEFKDLYRALLTYFERDLKRGVVTPLMQFMFTRYVTKLISFRRRIGELLGYTGGESMEQITLAPEVAALPIQSYAPRELATRPEIENGGGPGVPDLPPELIENPARTIESLPNYQRPSLTAWLQEKERDPEIPLTIGDLMDLGFDPTRLKEINLGGQDYIFERIQARQVPELKKKKTLLIRAGEELKGLRVRNASLKCNPPLITIADRGNAYVLHRKIAAIHWEEAVEQLQMAPSLRKMNTNLKMDSLVKNAVRLTAKTVAEKLSMDEKELRETVTWFVSWDLRRNQPKVIADFTGTFWESVWMA